jgi:hypothetical protein
MRKDKVRAYKLRREGKSYKQINRLLGIPLGTLGGWFKDEDWSQEIRNRLGKEQSLSSPKKLKAIIKANKKRWSDLHQKYRAESEKQFETLKNDPLFLAGVMLYWGEGEKDPRYSRIKLSNSDPLLIQVFYDFLCNSIKIPKDNVYAYLVLYPDLSDAMQKNFWSRATGIPLTQFKNTIYLKGLKSSKRRSYGVCNIIVNSREQKEKIMTWIDLCRRMLGTNS